MSDEMTQPEPRAGDTWKYNHAHGGAVRVLACPMKDVPGGWWFVGGGCNSAFAGLVSAGEARLVSRAQAAPTVDRAGCADWCGLLSLHVRVPLACADGSERPAFINGSWYDFRFDRRCSDGLYRSWCTALCRDERRAPVEASVHVGVDSGAPGGDRTVITSAAAAIRTQDEIAAEQWKKRPTPMPDANGFLPQCTSTARHEPEARWGQRCLLVKGHANGHDFGPSPALSKPRPPAGITCRRCLVTSEGGAHHMDTCPRRDFDPGDANLTSAQWSARVSVGVASHQSARDVRGRPYVPAIDDFDLLPDVGPRWSTR